MLGFNLNTKSGHDMDKSKYQSADDELIARVFDQIRRHGAKASDSETIVLGEDSYSLRVDVPMIAEVSLVTLEKRGNIGQGCFRTMALARIRTANKCEINGWAMFMRLVAEGDQLTPPGRLQPGESWRILPILEVPGFYQRGLT